MFKTPYIQIDDLGIGLIKDCSIKTHIDFCDIKSISIVKGFLSNNWLLMLALGVSLLIVSASWVVSILSNWNFELGDTTLSNRGHLLLIVTPFVLSIGSVLMIVMSLRRSQKLVINIFSRTIRISIKELEKENRIEELTIFLKEKLNPAYTEIIRARRALITER
jgi:hypothetical protein